jgi:hypothetical protein
MKKSKIVSKCLYLDIFDLVSKTDHKTLGIWAADCAEECSPILRKIIPLIPAPERQSYRSEVG